MIGKIEEARVLHLLVVSALAFAVLAVLPGAASAHVYWANAYGNATGRAYLDGTDANQSFIPGASFAGNAVYGVAVDAGHVYWANAEADTIGRANLDGTNVNQNFITGADYPRGVAVDAGHVYWTNLGSGTIGRANLDGTDVNESFITDIGSAQGIAVDAGHIYWANSGSGTIGRANLDGTEATWNWITGANAPNGVAVDSGHIYWANAPRSATPAPTVWDTIGRANLDGTNVNQRFITGADNPTGVAVDAGHIYWANFGTTMTSIDGIARANLDGTNVNQSFITGASFPWGVAVDSLPPPPTLSVSDTTVTEGDSGQANVTMTVSTTATAPQALGFHYETSNGGATAPSDYQATSGDSSIPNGQSSTTITVPVKGDAINEDNETLVVALSAPTNGARIGDGHAVLTIANDDALPSVSIADAATLEGDSGQSNVPLSVSLNVASSKTVTVGYATSDATADQPRDYLPASGTLTFPPGQTARTVALLINSDSIAEGNEILNVDLSAPTDATVGDGHAILTIFEEATPPPSSVSPPPATGRRAAALKKCKKRFPNGPRRKKCIKSAKKLPV